MSSPTGIQTYDLQSLRSLSYKATCDFPQKNADVTRKTFKPRISREDNTIAIFDVL